MKAALHNARGRRAAWLTGAVSSLVLGAQLACDDGAGQANGPSVASAAQPLATSAPAATSNPSSERDRDCCMGLNDCKGKGGCAVPESHACRGHNACKGQGGCNAHCPM